MQCTINLKEKAKKAQKPSLHNITLTGGPVVITQLVSLHDCDLFLFILVTHTEIARLLQNS